MSGRDVPLWAVIAAELPATMPNDVREKHANRIRHALAAAGYAVVPVEPTQEMENACIRASLAYLALHALKSIWPWHNRRHVRGNIRACYRAMLAAAGETKE